MSAVLRAADFLVTRPPGYNRQAGRLLYWGAVMWVCPVVPGSLRP